MKIIKGQIRELEVNGLAFGGKGIAKIKDAEEKDLVIFIDGALPGQTVEAKITRKKRRYAEAKLINVLKRASDEIALDFQETPGAPWMRLPIEIQQEYKKAQVFELFAKFAEIDLAGVFDTYISAPETFGYRNKMDYSFGPTEEHPPVFSENDEGEKATWAHSGFGLGSKKRGQFWLVENLEKPSGMFDEAFETFLPKLRTFCESLEGSVYNSRTNKGFWRQLVVRKSFSEDKFLINIVTNLESNHSEFVAGSIEKFVEFCNQNLPEKIKGVYWTQSDDTGNANDKYSDRTLVYGEEKITEVINGLSFEISIDSFFQTNIFSAEKLYEKVINYASANEEVLELFSGTGTISQILGQKNPKMKIVSIEIVASAVEDAKKNAEKNNIKNIKFICEDVNKFMKRYKARTKTPSVILDPPRSGISPKALQKIIDFMPTEIVYVSCNPATLARDTATLVSGGYTLEKLSLVDQFPHTAHVECVSKFVKN